jgi:hypothetical protein
MVRKPKAAPQHPPQPIPAPSGHETTTELAANIFSRALRFIQTEIDGIIAGRIQPKEHDAASRVAWLAKQAASVASEERKADAERRRARDELDKDDVLGFLRALSGPEWSEVKREIDAKHTGRSGLA